MTFCSNCGTDAGNSKFCPNCGSALSNTQSYGETTSNQGYQAPPQNQFNQGSAPNYASTNSGRPIMKPTGLSLLMKYSSEWS